MGWEDRRSYRDPTRPTNYWAVLNGQVAILPVGKRRVAVHASFFLTAVFLLLLGPGRDVRWPVRVDCVAALFLALLTHELGQLAGRRLTHDFSGSDMVLHSLDGRSLLRGRRGPRTIRAILCGPAANLLLCVICGLFLWRFNAWTLNPVHVFPHTFTSWSDAAFHLRVLFSISAAVLLLNLLPLFPLDGGKILQLWLAAGEGLAASINMTTLIGLMGSGMLAIVSIALRTWILLFIAVYIFCTCLAVRWFQQPRTLVDRPDGPDYAASVSAETSIQRRRRLSRWTVRRLRRLARQEEQEQHALDAILAKVSALGLNSLTWREKRALRDATSRQWAGEDDDAEIEPQGTV